MSNYLVIMRERIWLYLWLTTKYQCWVFVLICFLILHQTAMAQTVVGVNPEFSKLIARCAPTVHPVTMAAIISAESRGHQFAIADAGPVNLPWAQRKLLVRSYYFGSMELAVSKAKELIANGHTVSLGLAQVNDRNLDKLGLSVQEVFDPCTNLTAGGKIITTFYEKAVEKFGHGDIALRAALSAYNSGDWLRGEKDGYVSLVIRQVGKPLAMRSKEVVRSLVPRVSQNQRATVERLFVLSAREFVLD